MNTQELATCAQDGIPVKVVIANNGYLGMVRQWQELFWEKRYSHVDMGQFPTSSSSPRPTAARACA
jgi:acetolactate synthase-1/2/3 large subunit